MGRFGHPSLVTLPRTATANCKVGPHNVPRGADLWGATVLFSFSDRHWDDPFEFTEKHFLDATGKFTKKNKAMHLFGFGKRDCVAQDLAVKELFCILSQLMHRYKFNLPAGAEDDFELPENWFQMPVKTLPLTLARRF